MTQTPTPPANFEAPWHGQVFALAVAMNEAGHFDWPDWTIMFGANLDKMRGEDELDGSDDYYVAWVSTLEQMMVEKNIVVPDMLADMKTLWTEAFLRTPHGQPVIPAKL